MSGQVQKRLFLDPRPSAGLVSVALVYPGPEAVEEAGRMGWTALLFDILRAGGGRVAEDRVADSFDRWGGGLRSVATPSAALLVYDCLPEYLEESLGLLRAIRAPEAVPPRLFRRERAARIAALEEERSDPAVDAVLRVRDRLFGDHVLSSAPSGRAADLESATPEALEAFARIALDPGGELLAVSGMFDPDRVCRIWEEWTQGEREFILPALPPPAVARPFSERIAHDREQTVVVQAFPAAGVSEPDFRFQSLALHCLNGLSGPLFEEIRERHGLAYYCSCRRVAGGSGGLLAFVSGCEESRAPFLAEQVRAVLERIAEEGFTAAEWEAGLAQARSGLLFGRQRTGWGAVRLATRAILGLTVDLGDEDERFWETVRREDVGAACRQVFEAGRESTLMASRRGFEPLLLG